MLEFFAHFFYKLNRIEKWNFLNKVYDFNSKVNRMIDQETLKKINDLYDETCFDKILPYMT